METQDIILEDNQLICILTEKYYDSKSGSTKFT